MRKKIAVPTKVVYLLPLVLCLAIAPGRAQEARVKIDHLEKLAEKAAEVVDVTLDGSMLKLAAKFLSEEHDPDEAQVKEMIKNLKGIYVRSFEFDKEGEYTAADVEAIRAQLHAPGWSRIVGVHSKKDGENTEVYFMGDGDKIKGLTIIAAEAKELTVVNIVGPIDLEKLSDLEGHLGVPKLELEKSGKAAKEEASHEKAK